MKPILAKCIDMYKCKDTDTTLAANHIHFQLQYPDKTKRILIITTGEGYMGYQALESQFIGKESEFWQETSWQNALLMAWRKYIKVIGYHKILNESMEFQLIEGTNGSYTYDLTNASKKKIWENRPICAMFKNAPIEEDQYVELAFPLSGPTWFS